MKVELKDLEQSTKEVVLTFPGDRIDSAVDDELRKIARRSKIKGFRPGKAPLSAVRAAYGASAMESATNRVLQEVIQESMSSEELDAVAAPEVQDMQRDEQNQVVLTYRVEVFPDAAPQVYSDFELEREIVDVTDKDVEDAIGRILDQRSSLESVERPATTGDTVRFDFKGSVDGEYFEGGSAENHSLEIGSGSFIPGFEEQIEGLSAGTRTTISVRFPDDYQKEDLAGKDAQFEISLHEVQEKQLPELTDELAQELTPGDDDVQTADDFRQRIRKDIQEYMQEESERRLQGQIAEKLIENNPFEVPESMVSAQSRQIAANFLSRYAAQLDMSRDDFDAQLERLAPSYRDMAERQVRTSILLHSIAERENIEVSDEEFETELARQAETYGTTAEDLRKRLNPQAMESIRASLIEKKTGQFIADKSRVTEVPAQRD